MSAWIKMISDDEADEELTEVLKFSAHSSRDS